MLSFFWPRYRPIVFTSRSTARPRVYQEPPGGTVFLCGIALEHFVLSGDTAEKNRARREVPGKHSRARCYVTIAELGAQEGTTGRQWEIGTTINMSLKHVKI